MMITMATFVAATHCNATRLKLDRYISGALDQQRYRQACRHTLVKYLKRRNQVLQQAPVPKITVSFD